MTASAANPHFLGHGGHNASLLRRNHLLPTTCFEFEVERNMLVIYLTGATGSKKRGGSSLSGLRFLELLIGRYGRVTVVTDDIRAPIAPGPRHSVMKIRSDTPPYGTSFRSLVRSLAIRMLNFPRPHTAAIEANGQSVLVVCNSFTRFLDRIQVNNARSVRTVCVVRGDVTSFDYQPFGESTDANPLTPPLTFLTRFDTLIFVSKTTKRNWEKVLTQPQRRYVLPNAIDENEVDTLLACPVEALRASLGWRPDEFHIAVVGSIQKRKGQDIFVAAAQALRSSVPRARVHFVGIVSRQWGGDEIATALRKMANDRFVIHGHREDALMLVRAADVAVMVSHSEAFPRTVAEYMALGKPIITTPVAGSDEMVVDGHTGLIIPCGDPNALVNALAAIATDPERRFRLGEAARKRYLAQYSMTCQERRFATIFGDVENSLVGPTSSLGPTAGEKT